MSNEVQLQPTKFLCEVLHKIGHKIRGSRARRDTVVLRHGERHLVAMLEHPLSDRCQPLQRRPYLPPIAFQDLKNRALSGESEFVTVHFMLPEVCL